MLPVLPSINDRSLSGSVKERTIPLPLRTGGIEHRAPPEGRPKRGYTATGSGNAEAGLSELP